MLFLFTFMIIVILTFIFIALYNHHYRNATVATVFFVGITIMIVANTIYQVHIGGLSSSWINNNRGLYDFIIGIRFFRSSSHTTFYRFAIYSSVPYLISWY